MLKQIRRLLSTIAVQKSLENVRKISLMIYQTQEKFQKIISSHFVYSLRLLSISARQKSTENKRKICLMIYQNQEKFQKNYSELFEAYWETTFHFSRLEFNRKQTEDMSDGISDTGKIPKNDFESFFFA